MSSFADMDTDPARRAAPVKRPVPGTVNSRCLAPVTEVKA
jgi:hypothetical protein